MKCLINSQINYKSFLLVWDYIVNQEVVCSVHNAGVIIALKQIVDSFQAKFVFIY